MKNLYLLPLVIVSLIIFSGTALAVDWSPQGDINLKNKYVIKNGLNITFHGNISGNDGVIVWANGTIEGVSGGGGNGSDGRMAGGGYWLYNDTSFIYVNGTRLNETIDARDSDTIYGGVDDVWLNETGDTLKGNFTTDSNSTYWIGDATHWLGKIYADITRAVNGFFDYITTGRITSIAGDVVLWENGTLETGRIDNGRMGTDDYYLYNDTSLMGFNATRLNETIDSRDDDTIYGGVADDWVNETGDVMTGDLNISASLLVGKGLNVSGTFYVNTTGGILLVSYTSCSALETDINGNLKCGVDDTAGNASYPGDIWVNETGDTMTGNLNMNNKLILYAINGTLETLGNYQVSTGVVIWSNGTVETGTSGGADGRMGAGGYWLYNDTSLIYVNGTRLNETIDARDSDTIYGGVADDWVNETGDTMSGPLNISNVIELYTNGTTMTTEFDCPDCINSKDVEDIDDVDIEGDLNTYVDVAGDVMVGDLNISTSLLVHESLNVSDDLFINNTGGVVFGLYSSCTLKTDASGNLVCGSDASGSGTGQHIFESTATDIRGSNSTEANKIFNWSSGGAIFGKNVNISNDIFIGNSNNDHYIYFYDNNDPYNTYIRYSDIGGEHFGFNDPIITIGLEATTGDIYTSFGGDIYTSFGGDVYSSGDIYTTGSNDDLWLGTTTQENSNMKLYANGSISTVEWGVNTTGGMQLGLYQSCTALETDANGALICGTDAEGAGTGQHIFEWDSTNIHGTNTTLANLIFNWSVGPIWGNTLNSSGGKFYINETGGVNISLYKGCSALETDTSGNLVCGSDADTIYGGVADDWVNETGDIMTGDLNITGSMWLSEALNVSDNFFVNSTGGVNLTLYKSCTALETDSSGNLKCGSDADTVYGGVADDWVNVTGDVMSGDLNITDGTNYVNMTAGGKLNMTGQMYVGGNITMPIGGYLKWGDGTHYITVNASGVMILK